MWWRPILPGWSPARRRGRRIALVGCLEGRLEGWLLTVWRLLTIRLTLISSLTESILVLALLRERRLLLGLEAVVGRVLIGVLGGRGK